MSERAYQTTWIVDVLEALAVSRSVLGVMPTGGGKTNMFSEIATEWPGRVLIVAHRRELIKQAIRRVPGAAAYPSATPGRISVGSVQTLGRRLEQMPQFDLVIIDEAHHGVAGGYAGLFGTQHRAKFLGVTATPERLDGRGLGAVFDRMVVGPSTAELIEGGYLSPIETFGPPGGPPDVVKLHTVAGDFSPRDLAQLMDKPKVIGDAVEHYSWHAPGQPAIVFCASVLAAEHTAEAFRAKGWRAVAVSGTTPEHLRDAILGPNGSLATGEIEVVCSCALIDEGLDIPNVSCVLDMAPTKSLSKFLQRAGRGLRPAKGKRCLTFLDHAGNCLRHGMPDEVRTWSLNSASRRSSGAPPTRQCPSCYAIHSPRPACPACGFDYERALADVARREAERIEGELARMTPRDKRMKLLRETPLADLLKGASHDLIAEIAAARDYHNGWVRRQVGFRNNGGPPHTYDDNLGAITDGE